MRGISLSRKFLWALGLLSMMCVLITGCASTSATRDDAVLSSERDDAVLSSEEDAIAVPTGDPTRPSDLLVSFLLPASSQDLRNSLAVQRADGRLRADALGSCMDEQGFSLSFHSTVPPDSVPRIYHFPDLASITKYGFFEDPETISEGDQLVAQASDALIGEEGGGSPPLGPPPGGMSADEAEALQQSYSACLSKLEEAGASPLETFRQRQDALYTQWMELVLSLDRSDAIVAAQQTWVDCMQRLGWDVEAEDQFFAALDGQILNSTDSGEQERIELSARQHYVTCTEGMEQVRRPVREQARGGFIDENFAVLVEAEREFRTVLEQLAG